MADETAKDIASNLANAIAKDDANRKSRVAAAPLDPAKETFMGESVGAKPTNVADQAAASGMLNLAPRRRQRMAPRAAADIDPSKLSEFMAQQAATKTDEAKPTAEEAPPAVEEPKLEEEKPTLGSLMIKTPSPEPLAAEETKPESPKEDAKPVSPIAVASPEAEEVAKTLSPEVVVAEELKPQSPNAASPKQPASDVEGRLTDYDRICTYFVPNEPPNARVLVTYLQPLIKEELPQLREKTKQQEADLAMLNERLAQKESEVTQALAKAAEAEQKATAVVATATNQAVENAAINDEDVNRLRSAFEDHLQSYQQSMDQFQSFFDKITSDLETTFKDLGIEEGASEATAAP